MCNFLSKSKIFIVQELKFINSNRLRIHNRITWNFEDPSPNLPKNFKVNMDTLVIGYLLVITLRWDQSIHYIGHSYNKLSSSSCKCRSPQSTTKPINIHIVTVTIMKILLGISSSVRLFLFIYFMTREHVAATFRVYTGCKLR